MSENNVTTEDGHGRIIEQTVDNGDGTGTRTTYDERGEVTSTEKVEMPLPAPPTIDEARALLATLDAEQRLVAIAETVTPEHARILAPLLPEWTPDETVTAGALRTHDGVIYEAIQGHTTQDGWEPPETPALWRVWRDAKADVPPEWVRPTGAHDAYAIGERVTYQGSVYESLINANTYSPTEYPAGWRLIKETP